MAATSYSTSDVLTRKIWSTIVHHETMQRTVVMNPAHGLCSEKATTMCQELTDLKKGRGDQIKTTLIKQLQGAGVMGTDNLAGREEALRDAQFSIVIDKFRHGVGTNGEISDQRVQHDTMEEAKEMLADWAATRLDVWAAVHLCGFACAATSAYKDAGGTQIDGTDLRYTGGNAITDPGKSTVADTEHIVRPSSRATDELLVAGDEFDVAEVDTAITKLKQIEIPLRPIKYKGNENYLCFLHPNQVRDARLSSTQWYATMQNALAGGLANGNPLFTGSLGEWNGVIFKEWVYVSPGVVSTTAAAHPASRRAFIAGAQSLCIAWGKGYGQSKMKWTHEEEDHDDKYYAGLGWIGGAKATEYESKRFGNMLIATYTADAV